MNYRQAWIDKLREEMARFTRLAAENDGTVACDAKVKESISTIVVGTTTFFALSRNGSPVQLRGDLGDYIRLMIAAICYSQMSATPRS